jgi:hypothetical protein
MKTDGRPILCWKPTDPEGRRWELWDYGSHVRSRRYLGRVMVWFYPPEPPIFSIGYFTDTYRDRRHRLMPARWHESSAATFHAAARLLLSIVTKRETPASSVSKRGQGAPRHRVTS